MNNKQIKLMSVYMVMAVAVFFAACKSNEAENEEGADAADTAVVEEAQMVDTAAAPVADSPNEAIVKDIKTWIASGSGTKTITLNAINWDGDEISAEGKAQLDVVAALLEANPSLKGEIQGHTAKKGNGVEEAAAKAASKARAIWTKGKLVIGRDAIAKNLTTKGYGSEKPLQGVDPADESQKRITIELSK